MFSLRSVARIAMQLSLDLSTSPLEAMRDGLLKTFGPQRPTKRLDPVSQLIKSSISGRTKDAVSWGGLPPLEGTLRHLGGVGRNAGRRDSGADQGRHVP
jgi:hypothetical protein